MELPWRGIGGGGGGVGMVFREGGRGLSTFLTPWLDFFIVLASPNPRPAQLAVGVDSQLKFTCKRIFQVSGSFL